MRLSNCWLFIFMLAFNVLAQEPYLSNGDYAVYTFADSIRLKYFAQDFLFAWDEYTKECYADSTRVIYWDGADIPIARVERDSLGRKVIDHTKIPFGGLPTIGVLRDEWYQLDPTFIGFIEWLKTKRK